MGNTKMKIVTLSLKLLITLLTYMDINFITTISLSNSYKNNLREGVKTKENSKEASKVSALSKEGIEIELEKHRMKMRHRKRFPKLRNFVTENLIANTARYILDHGLERSIVENNNSRYNILTAKDAADNQELNKPKIYENDKNPYYGKIGDSLIGNSIMDMNKNTNYVTESTKENSNYVTVSTNVKKRFADNIYPKDRMPYYGPADNNEPTKIILNAPKDKFLTPIEIKDLSDVIDSEENKKRLENEINDIDNNKYSHKDEVYKRDPLAYYDPTVKDKEDKKIELKSALEQVKKDLNMNGPEFTEENFKVRQKIQNFENNNKEKDNGIIRNNYWSSTKAYDVSKNTKYTAFNIGTEADENKHKVVSAFDQSKKSDKFYYPSNNKKYEADDVLNDNIAEKTSKSLDGKIEADGYYNEIHKNKHKGIIIKHNWINFSYYIL